MKITKSLKQSLEDCEDHLLFLKEAYDRHPKQPFRYKQMAAELRVLVCATKNNHALLLDLMADCEYTFSVDPYEPTPFGPRPLIRTDEFEKYVEMAGRMMKGDASALAENSALTKPIPLPEFIRDGYALMLCGCNQDPCSCDPESKKWSWQRLIRGVAEQIGSSHEDRRISAELERARTFIVSGPTPLSALPAVARFIGEVARIVLEGGAVFLRQQAAAGNFQPRHFGLK